MSATGVTGPPSQPDCVVFRELIAPTAMRVDAAVATAEEHLAQSPAAPAGRLGLGPHARYTLGLSPHAPYTVHPDLLARVVELSRRRHVPLAMHLAESKEEIEFLRTGGGQLRHMLEELNAWDGSLGATNRRPLDYLRLLAKADRALVIHGNYLSRDEMALLAEHRATMSAVYCSRTHEYFAHDPYPLVEMLAAGVRVALGTDSRASNPDLNMLEEMRTVARLHPLLSPGAVFELATRSGAQGLGLESDYGALEPGMLASFVVVALPSREARDPYELLVAEPLRVLETWHRGRRVFAAVAD